MNLNICKIITLSILLFILVSIVAPAVSAATNDTDPFSPGNAKKAYDSMSDDFKTQFMFLFGLFWLGIGSFIMLCFGGSAASYSAHKSGQFTDPERKAGGATSMLAIILIAVGLIICILAVKPIFGF
jgi:hypothetical protein